MRLSYIKKLKVPELRSRLREVGLDTRGLKAELVDRLWAELISINSGSVTEGAEVVRLQHDDLRRHSTPTEIVAALASSSEVSTSPAAAVGVTPPYESDRTTQYSDSATQTETEGDLQTLQPGSESASEDLRVCQAEGGAHGPAEDRGRAFYEFKEEIRYKR